MVDVRRMVDAHFRCNRTDRLPCLNSGNAAARLLDAADVPLRARSSRIKKTRFHEFGIAPNSKHARAAEPPVLFRNSFDARKRSPASLRLRSLPLIPFADVEMATSPAIHLEGSDPLAIVGSAGVAAAPALSSFSERFVEHPMPRSLRVGNRRLKVTESADVVDAILFRTADNSVTWPG